MGAPNVIRGGSHSGNVAATELGDSGLLDILSSDYIPASLLMGAVRLGQRQGDLVAGIRMVTSTPADAAGLDDRGRLEVGKRADIIRFCINDDLPMIGGVYARGRQVA
jgi:alpha-D-ribose 1-methylphosphonate 5-triphosphate diphosphatase